MKKSIIALLICLKINSYAQVQNGVSIPEINFKPVLNAPVKSAKLSQLKGKIVMIDFWGTWCGSCIEAMPHLQQLQKKYAAKLQVITVTDETFKRTRQYLASRPSNLWFAVDTGRKIHNLFPHRLVPHTVLISPEGKLIANTLPASVTNEVIDSILRGEQVHLALKKDLQYTSPENLIKTVFPAADTVKQRFILDGELAGAPGLSTTYKIDSIWSGRRITAINCNILALYRLAYGNFPFERIVNKTAVNDKSAKYRLDIIVENKSDLLPTLKKELKSRFDIQAQLNLELKDVKVLKITDQDKFNKIPVNTSGKRTYYGNHGAIDQQAMTMNDLADYLESYGTGNLMVVDETQINKKFDIKFSFQPENPESLTKVLTDMGLSLEKDKRKIDMLVLYK